MLCLQHFTDDAFPERIFYLVFCIFFKFYVLFSAWQHSHSPYEFPSTLRCAHAYMTFNLATSHCLRSELDKAQRLLHHGSTLITHVPRQALLLFVYLCLNGRGNPQQAVQVGRVCCLLCLFLYLVCCWCVVFCVVVLCPCLILLHSGTMSVVLSLPANNPGPKRPPLYWASLYLKPNSVLLVCILWCHNHRNQTVEGRDCCHRDWKICENPPESIVAKFRDLRWALVVIFWPSWAPVCGNSLGGAFVGLSYGKQRQVFSTLSNNRPPVNFTCFTLKPELSNRNWNFRLRLRSSNFLVPDPEWFEI